MADLKAQIEQEFQEIVNAPTIPRHQWVGTHKRCHICGAICGEHDLKPFDQHTGRARMACSDCHPMRGK